ncbi:MAG: PEGA domain-containing protein [Labilithrix sp.]|nr:PEGA domain-containing protein [Labilithrix sp.]
MRTPVLVLAAVLALSPAVARAQGSRDDLARARALDQQGAKAYADGRYNDAIRYFEEAHRLGGPPFELWNIAKCHVRLDQPEQAAEMLEKYLATRSLPADDREEATQQLEGLRRRPSTLTIASTPSGAGVAVDGRAPLEGNHTPLTTTVAPGTHTITLTMPSHAPYTQQVEAKYGRAIIMDARLSADRRSAPPENPYGPDEPIRRVALRSTLGVMLPRYGSVSGGAQPSLSLSGVYRAADAGATAFGVGGALFVTGDGWQNTVNAPGNVPPCGALNDATSATALSIFAMGTAGWEILPRLRVHTLGGIGLATYFVGQAGGDLFVPTCSASPGVRPAVLLGAQVDYAVTPTVRITALPLAIQFQPAFGGARSTPVDASGVWLRATFGVGVGVDL